MFAVGAIFGPNPLKTGTNLLHPLPPSIVTETKWLFCMKFASVQKTFVFHANKVYQYREAVYHHRDHMRYLVSLMSAIWAGLPDGGGVSGEIDAGVGSTVIVAIGSPKTFRSG